MRPDLLQLLFNGFGSVPEQASAHSAIHRLGLMSDHDSNDGHSTDGPSNAGQPAAAAPALKLASIKTSPGASSSRPLISSGGRSVGPVEGTNVVRVPFGVRQARRGRPERPDHWATLVLPFHAVGGDPTPPPQAA